VLCICGNIMMPRLTLGAIDYQTLGSLIAQQSDLLYCFSLSTLPIQIMNDIMEDAVPGARAGAKAEKAPSQPTDQHANSSADFSLIRADRPEIARPVSTGKIQRDPISGPGALAGRHPPGILVPVQLALFQQAVRCPFRGAVVFFLLPRSSVNEDAPIRSLNCGIPAGVCHAGFFICPAEAGVR
jgi:hypothetical protein